LVSDHQRRGRWLQRATITWNLLEVGVTIGLGIAAHSLALVAFGLDSLIEVFASLVVLWHMADSEGGAHRDHRAQTLVGWAFALLAISMIVTGIRSLVLGLEPGSSIWGMVYLAVTAVVMFVLATWKRSIGRVLQNGPFLAEARLTFLDGWLAVSILVALGLNHLLGWWWADALAAVVIGGIAAKEASDLARSE
jgi:divalent metal cation (Fe/Co/Zn/Cd) transporter